MTTTVLVPSDEGRTALATLDNVSPVVYDPAGPMPAEAADAGTSRAARARTGLARSRASPRGAWKYTPVLTGRGD